MLLRTSMMRRDRATATGAISVFCLSAAYHAFLLVAAILDRHGRTTQVSFSRTQQGGTWQTWRITKWPICISVSVCLSIQNNLFCPSKGFVRGVTNGCYVAAMGFQ